jgi:hypothetical protein
MRVNLKGQRPVLPEDKREESGQRFLRDGSYVAMWRDREDMLDSTEWVRQIRKREWNHRRSPLSRL